MRPAQVHRVQVRGRVLVGLAAGEEADPRHRRRHVPVEDVQRPLGDLVDAGALGGLVAGEHHVRLQHRAAEIDALVVELRVERLLGPSGRLRALVDRVGRRPSAPRARRSAPGRPPARARHSGRARARSPRRSTRSACRLRSSRSRATSRTAPRARGTPRSRSRSPSSPSVTVSPGASASGFAPRSTLIPGMIPRERAAPGTASRRTSAGGSSRRRG